MLWAYFFAGGPGLLVQMHGIMDSRVVNSCQKVKVLPYFYSTKEQLISLIISISWLKKNCANQQIQVIGTKS